MYLDWSMPSMDSEVLSSPEKQRSLGSWEASSTPYSEAVSMLVSMFTRKNLALELWARANWLRCGSMAWHLGHQSVMKSTKMGRVEAFADSSSVLSPSWELIGLKLS